MDRLFKRNQSLTVSLSDVYLLRLIFSFYFGQGLKGKKTLAFFPCEKSRSKHLDIVPMQRNSYAPIKPFGTFRVMKGWEMLSLPQSTCTRSFGQLVKHNT
jgi:hypothetical protein